MGYESGYTKGILVIRILSYCVALFRVLHLGVTSKFTITWINKENMVLSLSEEPIITVFFLVPIRTYTTKAETFKLTNSLGTI